MVILHVGCGRKKSERFGLADTDTLITLDADPTLEPDIVCTLGRDRIDLPDDSVDGLIALHILEHIGRQGETDQWFYFWEEAYRVLKPDGELHFESPLWNSVWSWADPQHCRALSPQSFLYFSQDSYRNAESSITPYRIKCDFDVIGTFSARPDRNANVAAQEEVSHFSGAFRAIKPLRPWWEV